MNEFLFITKVPETSYPPSGVQRAEENTTGITGAYGVDLPQSLRQQNRENSGRHKPAYQVCRVNFTRFIALGNMLRELCDPLHNVSLLTNYFFIYRNS